MSGWKKRPVGGACGADERREGRRSFVSAAMSERRLLDVVEGSGGGGARRGGARRSGKRLILGVREGASCVRADFGRASAVVVISTGSLLTAAVGLVVVVVAAWPVVGFAKYGEVRDVVE